MAPLEDSYESACESLDIRGAILLAATADGNFQYQRAFGEAAPNKRLTPKSTFWIASCSKLITSIAVLKCVEEGQIGLDEDVTPILHELKGIQILRGFDPDSGKPVLEKATRAITLRHLLTHSSGVGYDFVSPLLGQWRSYHHEEVGIPASKFTSKYLLPLLFEPGQGWEYGAGIDWVGILVERLSGTNLQDFLQRHIWNPLDIQDMTFHLDQRPDIRAKLAHTSKRSKSGKIGWVRELIIPDPSEEALGGAGIYSTAEDYFKVLRCVLANDGRLLLSHSIDEMFRPQLSPAAKQSMCELIQTVGRFGLPRGTDVDHSLAGVLNLADVYTGRKAGSISWGGYPNLEWWLDRVTGVCGLYASQLHPPADAKSLELYQLFQAEIYHRLPENV